MVSVGPPAAVECEVVDDANAHEQHRDVHPDEYFTRLHEAEGLVKEHANHHEDGWQQRHHRDEDGQCELLSRPFGAALHSTGLEHRHAAILRLHCHWADAGTLRV